MKFSSRLASLFVSLLLFSGLSFAQAPIDVIPPAQSSAYIDLGRNLQWGVSGLGGVNNNFIFSPLTPDQGICIYFHNDNSTSAHNITLAVWQTGDQTVTRFIGQQDSYIPISINQGVTNNTILLQTSPLSTSPYFFKSTGAAQIALQITGTSPQAGSPDTVDLLVVQTQQNCGQNSRVPIYCNQIANVPIPFAISGGNIVAITNTLLTGAVHVCGIWFFSTKDWTAAANSGVTIVQGTSGSNCLGGAVAGTLWTIIAATGFPEVATGGSELFESNPGVALCVLTGAYTAGTVNVVISYIIF